MIAVPYSGSTKIEGYLEKETTNYFSKYWRNKYFILDMVERQLKYSRTTEFYKSKYEDWKVINLDNISDIRAPPVKKKQRSMSVSFMGSS